MGSKLYTQRKISIRTKIILGNMLVMIFLLIAITVLSSRNSDLQDEITFVSDHDFKVHQLISLIEKQMLDMETGMRGFVITGDENYLEPYNAAISSWELNYGSLRSLLTDNPNQQANLDAIRTNILKWIETAGQYAVDAQKNGDTAAIERFFLNNVGKTQVDAIRNQIDSFRATEQTLTEDRVAALKENNQFVIFILYVSWLAVFVISFLISWFISGRIVRSVKQVTETIVQISSSGEGLDKRIEIETRDEVRELGKATNELLDAVQRQNQSKDHLARLSKELQEQNEVDELINLFVSRVSSIFEVPYAILYLKQHSNKLIKAASFAGGSDMLGREEFRVGEGLVGQCAKDGKWITVRDIPEGYAQVQSGIGHSAPKMLVLAPVQFEREVVAVLELAHFHEFTTENIELLEQMVNMLGVTIQSATRRKEIEHLYAESQTVNEELQVQSEELNAQATELLALNEDLQRSSNFKSEFLANMSHELRTPLNSMLILSQLLAGNSGNRLNEEEIHYVTTIHSAGQDLLNLINDILDLSKVEAGKLEIEMTPVVVEEIKLTMESYFTSLAEQKALAFQIVIDPNAPLWFVSDVFRVHQILKNLLSNAFKFTDRGGVTLTIAQVSREEWEKAELVFAIKDTGRGIPASQHEMIFEAFTQAEGGTARKFGGTGLGLTISNQLARLLGGRIVVESTVGQGSEFKLFLPLLETGSGITDDKTHGDKLVSAGYADYERQNGSSILSLADLMLEHRLNGMKVLIADDDERNLLALSNALAEFKMQVEVARDGHEALRKLSEHSFDYILMDIMMPDMDGYETIQVIREQRGLKVPIIAVTAKAMKEDENKCLEAGASNYISKPIHVPSLISVMISHLKS
ncbi:CHASE3 domain-containing protein [Cohnella lupini]|uniref:CHASE3 domain-containing protein n=1 Tax=Cohnella lupini TaxID=1294267 RepID=UPI0015F25980|nr:CHASE3 domain-containing protein [Cohnella lupini]